MIANRTSRRDAVNEAIEALSAHQDRMAAAGRQTTYTQAEIAAKTGLTRAGVEQLELAAKLRFLTRFARTHPQSFLELGGTLEQLAFLRSAALTSTNTRSLWRRWRAMSS